MASDTGQLLRDLMAAGIPGELFDRVADLVVEVAAIRKRRSDDAARAKEYRARKVDDGSASRDITDVTDAPPPNGFPSLYNPSLPLLPPPSLREGISIKSDWPKDFREQFWELYPRKVGKRTAFLALERVRKSREVAFPKLLEALSVAKWSTDPSFIPHPTTWINRGGWDDVAPGAKRTVERPQWLIDQEEAYAEQRRREATTTNGAHYAGDLLERG